MGSRSPKPQEHRCLFRLPAFSPLNAPQVTASDNSLQGGPIVAETPPFMRATTFAAMNTPGPFEKTAEAYFYVTLPDPAWPKNKQEQLLAFFSPPNISDTSVHEVYPGHYV
jgi:hypothetical protein